jgi:hypothetical protein
MDRSKLQFDGVTDARDYLSKGSKFILATGAA